MLPDTVTPAAVDGWNVDEDPANNPTFPMRDITGDRSKGSDWQQPTIQERRVEVLQSIEYARSPAVFGMTMPPSGLSGAIRRLAFKRSESDWWHWLLLMAADRINVVEGVIDDLGQGRIPNIPAEMGLRAEFKHNKPALARKAAVVVAVSAVALALLARRSSGPARRRRRDRVRYGVR